MPLASVTIRLRLTLNRPEDVRRLRRLVQRCDLLPGTKVDLREDKEVITQLAAQNLSPLKRDQGIKMASKIRAAKYLECSALTQRGLKQVR